MLTQEYGTASNIKSRVNRLSVLAAITSTQQRLKLYNRVPPNGLVLFVGTILTDEGKEKKVYTPFPPAQQPRKVSPGRRHHGSNLTRCPPARPPTGVWRVLPQKLGERGEGGKTAEREGMLALSSRV